LDFDLDPSIQHLDAVSKPAPPGGGSEIESSSLFQTFTRKNQAHFIEPSKNSDLAHWKNREAEEENFAASIAGQPRNQIPGNQSGMEKTETSAQAETGSAFQSLYARFSADPLFHDEIHKL